MTSAAQQDPYQVIPFCGTNPTTTQYGTTTIPDTGNPAIPGVVGQLYNPSQYQQASEYRQTNFAVAKPHEDNQQSCECTCMKTLAVLATVFIILTFVLLLTVVLILLNRRYW